MAEDNGEGIFTALSLIFLFIVGLGLGSTTTIDDFKKAAAKPKAVGLGFASQYLFMPVSAYVLCQIFDVDSTIAIGTILVGASPGGTTSNIYTYWSHGDVALSITMSFLSTCAAFFMLPLWIVILVKGAYDSDVEIAWGNIIAGCLLILIPTVGGLYIRHNNTEKKIRGKFIWQWIELATTVFGVLFLIAALTSALVIYENIIGDIPTEVWVLALLLQPLGCAFGFFSAKLLSMSPKDQKTISLETGVQNFTLTIAVINLTFQGEVLEKVLMFPLAYGLLYFSNSGILVAFYRWYLTTEDDNEDGGDDHEKVPSTDVEAGTDGVVEIIAEG